MAKKLKFPDGFFWGAATASYQVEGGIENVDWAKAAREGRVPEAGISSDHYNRYEEDFDIAKELGHNAHRFSIEWARIEPEEGKFDQKEIEHYRNVLKALHKRGIEPFITLWHFTLPLWFSESGGWERKDAPELFARYCEHIVDEIGNQCTHFATINEPIVVASNGWLSGKWPPFMKGNVWKFLKVSNSMARAHNLAYKKIKQNHAGCDVSIVKDNIYFHANWNPYNKLIAAFMNWFWNRRFLNKVHDHVDSIGLNFYFHKDFGGNEEYGKTDMGWDIYPEGIYHTLVELGRYHVPVYVAEAGIADEEDTKRAIYIKDLVKESHRALTDGVDLCGFMYWSLIDNYEWALGYGKRFGLVEIDYKTLERKVRPSAQVYKRICETNTLEY